jgi:2-oxoglutarate ferredoxin oxidoreductase subunit gamma
MRYEIRLSGEGGQGIILAALVLAEAVGVHGINYVAQSQSYGPEARGGFSKAEVVISDDEIDYPKAVKPDLLLAMNQVSCNAYYRDLKPDGILIVDSSKVEKIPTTKAIAVPFTEMARELKKPFVANMIALGVISSISEAIDLDDVKKAISSRVPPGTEELNLKAFELGVEKITLMEVNFNGEN